MRSVLKKYLGLRFKVYAEVDKFGQKSAYRGLPKTTILLKDIKDENGVTLTDHLWLTVGKRIDKHSLTPGDLIEFDGRVTEYVKGYQGSRWGVYAPIEKDYRLSNPTRIRKIQRKTS